MPNGKRVLGRGLAELLPVGGDAGRGDIPLGPGQEIPVALVHPNPRQPRTRFDDAALNELTDSVKENGILQPLLVRPRPAGGYEIVAGERRYRAALKAGLRHVPVVVRQLSDDETLALALIENLIREDIGPLETARAFQRLMEDFGWTQEEMGRRVGKSRSAVANALRLLKLPDAIQLSLEQGELTEGHARALLGDDRENHLPGFRERQSRIWLQTIEKHLSVREVERMMSAARTVSAPESRSAESRTAETRTTESRTAIPSSDIPPPISTPNMILPKDHLEHTEVIAIEDRLRTTLETRVRLNGTLKGGRIEIEYFSSDQLDALLTRLGVVS
jgi:ParB family transcriptional regulator, chromosome partitioning protein